MYIHEHVNVTYIPEHVNVTYIHEHVGVTGTLIKNTCGCNVYTVIHPRVTVTNRSPRDGLVLTCRTCWIVQCVVDLTVQFVGGWTVQCVGGCHMAWLDLFRPELTLPDCLSSFVYSQTYNRYNGVPGSRYHSHASLITVTHHW